MLVKKYFTYVSMLQSIIANLILGLIFSPFALFALFVFLAGLDSLFQGEPIAVKYILSSCIPIFIFIFSFIMGNIDVYKRCKKTDEGSLELTNDKLWILKGIIVVIAYVCSAFILSIIFILHSTLQLMIVFCCVTVFLIIAGLSFD